MKRDTKEQIVQEVAEQINKSQGIYLTEFQGLNVAKMAELRREFNGKWYTDVKAWKLESAGQAGSSQSQQEGSYNPPAYEHQGGSAIVDDDCPF